MSPHKAEARLIGTILVITAVSCLASAVGEIDRVSIYLPRGTIGLAERLLAMHRRTCGSGL